MASTSGVRASGSSPSFSSEPEHESFPYEVFLNFRGVDTRKNFIDHLYDRLTMAGVHTFMDDNELQKGQDISVQLMRAIDESRIYIVVFSPNYGSSTWCFKELVKITEKLSDRTSRVLFPVFYGVEPSDVRHQVGSFGDAFKHHHKNILALNSSRGVTAGVIKQKWLEYGQWQEALQFASNFSGFSLEISAMRSDSRLINQIIKEVLVTVRPKTLFVAKYRVGLDSRVNEVYSLLKFEASNHAQLIGIWGMGGLGKSVIAKALYNKIHQSFELSCFLASVRADSQTPRGLEQLQEKLISMVLMRENATISCIDQGIEMIRKRLGKKKVLIVLDDIDKLNQVDALAGHRSWFGPGSIIVITTRDQHLLNLIEADGRYEVKELNSKESLELFSWHSFRNPFPKKIYALIADKIISYCCGFPLALEVLGAFLFGRTIQQWNIAFAMLQENPRPEIQKILQISYEGLDIQERKIFLDIACFFVGKDIDHVSQILNSSNSGAELRITILCERCLVTVNDNNELRMHDLIREMGREIVFQTFPNEPGKRSHLWSYQVAKDVLMGYMGTESIEGITLVSSIKEEISLTTESFERMHNLRLLKMDNVSFNGNYKQLSKEIRWISWQNCSLKYLPTSLQMTELVALDMQHSDLRSIWPHNPVLGKDLIIDTVYSLFSRLWPRIQYPRHLKILNLSHSKFLTSTPDFRLVPELVTLILEGCTSLLQIDPSIGCLGSLLVLNMKDCEKIRNIPNGICFLGSLGYLNLSGCLNLKKLPDKLGQVIYLRELYADETALTKLPSSLSYLTNLATLSLRKCAVNILLLTTTPLCLRRLNLRDCNLTDEGIPSNMGNRLSDLRELDLKGNRLRRLPESFGLLINLQSLWLDDWRILTSVPGLPPNLQDLIAKNIHSLD